MLDEGRGKDAHEAGEHDQVGLEAVDGFLQGGIEGLARSEGLVVDHGGRDAVRLREREPLCVGLIADHGGNPGRPLLRFARPHDGLHIAASARNKDHDIFHKRAL
jgi:hypothetical protein